MLERMKELIDEEADIETLRKYLWIARGIAIESVPNYLKESFSDKVSRAAYDFDKEFEKRALKIQKKEVDKEPTNLD